AVIENTIQEIDDLLAKEKGAKERAPNGVAVDLSEASQHPGKDRSPAPVPLTPERAPSSDVALASKNVSGAATATPPVPASMVNKEVLPARPDHAGPVVVAGRVPEVQTRAS